MGFAPADCVAMDLAVAGGVSFCFWRRKTNPRAATIRKMRKPRILCFGAVGEPLPPFSPITLVGDLVSVAAVAQVLKWVAAQS